MGFESFYGGRQGASFVIVKRFDGIDIPQGVGTPPQYTYKFVYYAINQDGKFIWDDKTDPANPGFIIRNADNYYLRHWQVVELNGQNLDCIIESTQTDTTMKTDIVYQEGMVQCFRKGGDSVDVVNYGEYVIIDTISKDNPDNGKVYRRGMNYIYNEIDNPLAGAEYIGQIVGPRGETPDFNMELYERIPDPFRRGSYNINIDNKGIIPGVFNGTYYRWIGSDENIYYTYSLTPSEGDRVYSNIQSVDSGFIVAEFNSERNQIILNNGVVCNKTSEGDIDGLQYNDEILYRWATIRDEFGNVSDYRIGFKIPYLVPTMSGKWREPYYTQEDYNLGRIDDPNLIGTIIPYEADFDLFIDNDLRTSDRDPNHGDTGHPYYRKWKVSIPKGVKGDSLNDPRVFPTIIPEGTKLYANLNAEGLPDESGDYVTATEDLIIDTDNYYWTYDEGYIIYLIDGHSYYVRLVDTAELHYWFLTTVYDNNKNGESTWVDLGPYRNIKKVHLSYDGILTVYYTAKDDQGKDVVDIEEQITWPTQVTLTKEGLLKFLFNNQLIENIYPVPPAEGEIGIAGNQGYYKFILPWIDKVALNDTGEFKIYFNNDKNKQAIVDMGEEWFEDETGQGYRKNISWISNVQIDEDRGMIYFIYCDDTPEDPHRIPAAYRIMQDAWVDNGGGLKGEGPEGMGDQRIYIQFNIPDPSDPTGKETKAISRPINYVVETIVTTEDDSINPNKVPKNHLLVWYSDPDYRNKLKTMYPTRVYVYKGTKDENPKDGWYDLGLLESTDRTVGIIGRVNYPNDLYYDGSSYPIPYDPTDPPQDPILPENIGSPIPHLDPPYAPEHRGWAMAVGLITDEMLTIYSFDYIQNIWYPIGTMGSDIFSIGNIINIGRIEPVDLKEQGIWMLEETRVHV